MTDIAFGCPHCQQPLEAPSEMAGQSYDCPSCQKPFVVPSQPKPVSAPSKPRKKKTTKEQPVPEKPRDPEVIKYVADFINDYEDALYDLEASDMVKKISEAKKKKIFEYVEAHAEQLCADEYFLEDVIRDFFPSLIKASFLKDEGEFLCGNQKEKAVKTVTPVNGDKSKNSSCSCLGVMVIGGIILLFLFLGLISQ